MFWPFYVATVMPEALLHPYCKSNKQAKVSCRSTALKLKLNGHSQPLLITHYRRYSSTR